MDGEEGLEWLEPEGVAVDGTFGALPLLDDEWDGDWEPDAELDG